MGLPILTRRRRKHISLTELESRLPPPDLNTLGTRTEHGWKSTKSPIMTSAISYNQPSQAGIALSTEKIPSKHLSGEGVYDFSQAGPKRVEITPQRPPRPERTNVLNEVNDFRSILVPSPIPSSIQPPPPVTTSNTRQCSPIEGNYFIPSPSASSYRSATYTPKSPLEPPPLSPKSPLRKQRLPAPMSPPPSTPPPPIPSFPQAPPQCFLVHPGNTSYSVRQEVSYQDSHHYRESLSSTNISSSGRPSDVDAGNNPTLIPDPDKITRPSTSESMKRNSSKPLQSPKHPRLGHRRARTEGEEIPISLPGYNSADAQDESLERGDGALSRDGNRESKSSSIVLQLASGWDPSSSSEDESMVRGGKGKRKRRKVKKDGKYGKGKKGAIAVDR